MDVQELLSEADDHGFTRVSTKRKLAFLNDVYADVCSREAWPFLQKQATLSFNANSTTPTTASMPADFSKVISLIDSNGTPLEPERLDYMTKTYSGLTADRGQSYLYFFRGNTLHVYPASGSSQTLTLEYYAAAIELDEDSTEADILLPARHHRVLALGLLSRLYYLHDDITLGQLFDSIYETRILRMTDDLWMRQFDRPERIYPLDEWD